MAAKSLLAIARQAKRSANARKRKELNEYWQNNGFNRNGKVTFKVEPPTKVRYESIADILAELDIKRRGGGRVSKLDKIEEEVLSAHGLKIYLSEKLKKQEVTPEVREKLIEMTKQRKVENKQLELFSEVWR